MKVHLYVLIKQFEKRIYKHQDLKISVLTLHKYDQFRLLQLLILQLLEVVSRYRDPQPQVVVKLVVVKLNKLI